MSPIVGSLANGSAQGYGGLRSFAPATAFDSIATATGTGSSGTITFSNIPSTYNSLQIRIMQYNSVGANTLLRINGDTANSSYSRNQIAAYNGNTYAGTSFGAAGFINLSAGWCTPTSSAAEVGIINIIDYASTSKFKTISHFMGTNTNSAGSSAVVIGSGVWASTSAINSLTLFLSGTGNNYSTATKIALYGVK